MRACPTMPPPTLIFPIVWIASPGMIRLNPGSFQERFQRHEQPAGQLGAVTDRHKHLDGSDELPARTGGQGGDAGWALRSM
jgi:hypothetical protein